MQARNSSSLVRICHQTCAVTLGQVRRSFQHVRVRTANLHEPHEIFLLQDYDPGVWLVICKRVCCLRRRCVRIGHNDRELLKEPPLPTGADHAWVVTVALVLSCPSVGGLSKARCGRHHGAAARSILNRADRPPIPVANGRDVRRSSSERGDVDWSGPRYDRHLSKRCRKSISPGAGLRFSSTCGSTHIRRLQP